MNLDNILQYEQGPSLTDWYNILKEVNTKKQDHFIICENKGQNNIVLIRSRDYDSSKHRKLSLSEIVKITQDILNPPPSIDVNWSRLSKIALHDDVFTEDHRGKIINCLHDVEAESKTFDAVKIKLNEMSLRAKDKRTVEKTNSLWGYIQYYIYSWFFDQSSTIQALSYKVSSTNYQKEVTDTIQDRIILNIEFFHDAENTPEKESGDFRANSKVKSILSTPADVKKKWLIKYHPDKYKPNEESSGIFTQRIIILTKLWQAVIDRKPGEGKFNQMNNDILAIGL